MSIEIKQKIKEVADDFGMPAKSLIEIVGKFYDKPKSSSQNLTEDQLNVIFDYITAQNQIGSIAEVFAAAKPKEEPKQEASASAPAAEKPARFRSSRMGTCSATNASKNPDNNEKARSALFSFSVNTHCMSQTPIRLFFLPPPRRRGKTFPLSTKRFARAIGATPRIPSAKRRWEQKWRDNFRAACYTGRKSKERIA